MLPTRALVSLRPVPTLPLARARSWKSRISNLGYGNGGYSVARIPVSFHSSISGLVRQVMMNLVGTFLLNCHDAT
ncbi:hypothetical protein F4678DRAFT_429523 [Xylaria arbuscula]|nr:hypothetical protein F4678DRAFT_429523 [Xylaria arbuscula]